MRLGMQACYLMVAITTIVFASWSSQLRKTRKMTVHVVESSLWTMDLLNTETALKFLEKVGLKGGKELLSQDRLEFLTTIIRALQEHLPFQTVSNLAQAQGTHHVPSLEEVVEAGLSLEGGLCFTQNIFTCLLLRALHLDAHILDGSYSAFGDNHTHVVVLVKDLRYPDDSYIVDVGTGYPLLEPVPIAALPVHCYQAGLEFCYERQGDIVMRLHRTGDDNLTPEEKAVKRGDWRQVFHFTLNPVDLEFSRPYLVKIYTDTDNAEFLLSLRAARFPPAASVPGINYSTLDQLTTMTHKGNTVVCISEKKCDGGMEFSTDAGGRVMVAMKNCSLLLGKMDAVKKTKVNLEDWAATIKHYFPTIPHTKVECAIQRMLELNSEILKL